MTDPKITKDEMEKMFQAFATTPEGKETLTKAVEEVKNLIKSQTVGATDLKIGGPRKTNLFDQTSFMTKEALERAIAIKVSYQVAPDEVAERMEVLAGLMASLTVDLFVQFVMGKAGEYATAGDFIQDFLYEASKTLGQELKKAAAEKAADADLDEAANEN